MSNRIATTRHLRRAIIRFALALCAMLALPAVVAAGEHDHHHMPATEPPDDDSSPEAPVKPPDVQVLTQDGKKSHFYRDLVKGRTVLVDFIYTTCTAICSPMTANLRDVRQQLGDAADKVEFISITIDPKADTPPVLKAFAKQFDTGPHWSFVTADSAALAKLQKGFAVSMSRKEDHTPLLIIGNDATGKWTRKYGLAHPEVIVAAIRQVAGLTEATP
jgi:cytochrome oxidase Cu insertion factor (SCO1/SenC/PrrC family)